MLIQMLQCKIHGLRCTETQLHYDGSLTLDRQLMEQAGWLSGQKVQVVNVNTGGRFETYLIEGRAGSGAACLNGAAARLAQVGDKLLVMAYVLLDQQEARQFQSQIIQVDDRNRPLDPAPVPHLRA
jgi:aspartate 1-decarboxylase